MNQVVRLSAALSLTLLGLLAPCVAFAVDAGDIVVVSLKGEVHVTMHGAARAVRAGSVLEPPATLRTGRDGAVELRQGATTLSVGPETLLEFPALEKRGAPIDRIVQPRGNVFYNIGKREGRRLRIETPFLVGVVKGTQFNVAAQDQGTTISLFEGLLEVRAADDSSVVDLKAGEIASRQRDGEAINVLKMGAGKDTPPATPRQPAGSGSNNGAPNPSSPRTPPSQLERDSMLVDRGVAETVNSPVAPVTSVSNADPTTTASGVEVAAPRVDVSPASVDTGASVSVSAPAVEVSTSATVDAGAPSVDTGAAVNVSAPAADVSTTTTADAGPVAVDVDSSISPDVGAGSAETPVTTIDAGPIAAVVGGGAAVDLGAGTLDAGATAAVDAGALTTGVGAGAAMDPDAGTVGTAVDVSATTPVAVVDAGVSVAVDVTSGSVDLGLPVAGAEIDLGVELEDDGNNGHGNDDDHSDSSNPGRGPRTSSPDIDVGGLLDGLLRRRGKK